MAVSLDRSRIESALSGLQEVVNYGVLFTAGQEYPLLRDFFADVSLTREQQARLDDLDEVLLDYIVTAFEEEICPLLLEDHPDKPLERWWWHFGRIRRGEYPLELLPDHLLRVVEEARGDR